MRPWGSFLLPSFAALGAASLAAESAVAGALGSAALGYLFAVGFGWVASRRGRLLRSRALMLRTRRRLRLGLWRLRRAGWRRRRAGGVCEHFLLTPDGMLAFAIVAAEPTEAALDRLEAATTLLARAGRPVVSVCVWAGQLEELDGRVVRCAPESVTDVLRDAHAGFLSALGARSAGGGPGHAEGALERSPILAGQMSSPQCGRREAALTASALTSNAGDPA